MAIDAPEGPTDLYFVGPATATVFDGAPFAACDVADRRVSYRELLEAGIARDVADRLRREYSLVWSFEWNVGGDDLPRRADAIAGLGDAERAWIAESASGEDPGTRSSPDRWEERNRYLEEQSSGNPGERTSGNPDEPSSEDCEPSSGDGSPASRSALEVAVCPRCDGRLETFVLGDSETVSCGSCGYVGIAPG